MPVAIVTGGNKGIGLGVVSKILLFIISVHFFYICISYICGGGEHLKYNFKNPSMLDSNSRIHSCCSKVRGLCKQFKGDVYLTARDEARGKVDENITFSKVIFGFSNSELCFQQAAVASLEAEGLSPKFHLCDLGDLATVEALRDTIKER